MALLELEVDTATRPVWAPLANEFAGEKGSYLSPGMTDLNFQGAKWDASTQWEYE